MTFKVHLINYIKNEILEDTSIEINDKNELLSDGTIDSLGLMRIIRFIERQCQVEIPFEDITPDNFMTIGNITAYITKIKK